jgi:histidine triad (HIT) family protein
VAKDIPSEKVYEDDDFYAFRDINPKADTHLLLVPKKHIVNLDDLQPEDEAFSGSNTIVFELGIFPVWLQKFGQIRAGNDPVDSGRRVNEAILYALEKEGFDGFEEYEDDMLYKGFMDRSCFSRNLTKIKRKIEEMYGESD